MAMDPAGAAIISSWAAPCAAALYGSSPIGISKARGMSITDGCCRASVEEFGATAGRVGFGADAGALDDVFPHLRNFSTRGVGFMRRA